MKRALRAALVLASLTACGTSPEPTTFVCTQFRPGADLTAADFQAPAAIAPAYGALAQAAADVSIVSAAMLIDVQNACTDLALSLGAPVAEPRLALPRDRAGLKETCALAAELLAGRRAELSAKGVVVRPVTPRCPVDATLAEACEARCKVDPACVERSISERCKPADREGTCTGTCLGACVGSEIAPAACEGRCEGTCFGACDDGNGKEEDGCTSGGCVCKGTCSGRCTAACTPTSGGFACDATCRESCSSPLESPRCAGDVAAPSCAGDADCQNACLASASARATCEVGGVAVAVADRSEIDAELARVIASIERSFPVMLVASSDHAKGLRERASSLVDAAGRLLARSQDLGTAAAGCGLVMAQAGTDAEDDLGAVSAASKKVVSSLGP